MAVDYRILNDQVVTALEQRHPGGKFSENMLRRMICIQYQEQAPLTLHRHERHRLFDHRLASAVAQQETYSGMAADGRIESIVADIDRDDQPFALARRQQVREEQGRAAM